jgi:hypothetical protein
MCLTHKKLGKARNSTRPPAGALAFRKAQAGSHEDATKCAQSPLARLAATLFVAQKAKRKHQDGADKFEYSFDCEAYDPEGQEDKPRKRQDYNKEYGKGPAQGQQNAP